MHHVTHGELAALREVWGHFQQKLFCRLESSQAQAVTKLEANLLKLYVINSIQTKRTDKVKEFFDKMTPELQGNAEWKDWFALPFLPNPESNPSFAMYFSRQWQDSLMLSLFNFFALIFACLPAPRLADFNSTVLRIRQLREENDTLRQKLVDLNHCLQRGSNLTLSDIKFPDVAPPDELMDDFFTIAQEAPTQESQTKTLKSFLKNITGVSGASSQPSNVERKIGGSNAGKNLSSSLKQQPKSRSSSKSRLSSTPTVTTQQQQPSHAPVTRLSLSKHGSSASLLSQVSPSNIGSGIGGDKMTYILLGQEEYMEHHSEITHCRFSHSGSVVASSDVSGVIKVWNASPPAPDTIATFISNQPITALDWIPHSDRHFIYGTKTGVVRFCDMTERRTNSEVSSGEGCIIRTLTCSPNANCLTVSVSNENASKESLQVYDLKTMNQELDLLQDLPSAPLQTSCLFNHNAQMIISAGVDGKVRIFDLRKRDCISSWSVHASQPILNIALSADETSIYAITADAKFGGWSLYQSGQRIFEHQLESSSFDANASRGLYSRVMALAGDGKHLLTCGNGGGIIYKFGPSSIEKVLGLKGHRDVTTCTDWSSVNNCGPCVTAGKDGQIRVSTLLSQ